MICRLITNLITNKENLSNEMNIVIILNINDHK